MHILQIISIILEVVIAVMGIMIAVRNKKSYGWFITLTFVIYTFYDIVNYLGLIVPENILYGIFFVATISIFWAVFSILKR